MDGASIASHSKEQHECLCRMVAWIVFHNPMMIIKFIYCYSWQSHVGRLVGWMGDNNMGADWLTILIIEPHTLTALDNT